MKIKINLSKVILSFFFITILLNSYYFSYSKIYASDDLRQNNTLELYCNSDIAIDFDTGNILYEKNANAKIFPASTTKILTCIIAIENSNLTDTTVVSNKVIQNTPIDSSVMGVKAGELYTIEELLYGLMLPSRK